MGKEAVGERVVEDLQRLGLIRREDLIRSEVGEFRYAYVIYDLDHRKNVNIVLEYLRNSGIDCCGRFAECEYLNMDAVIEHSRKLAARLNGDRNG